LICLGKCILVCNNTIWAHVQLEFRDSVLYSTVLSTQIYLTIIVLNKGFGWAYIARLKRPPSSHRVHKPAARPFPFPITLIIRRKGNLRICHVILYGQGPCISIFPFFCLSSYTTYSNRRDATGVTIPRDSPNQPPHFLLEQTREMLFIHMLY
jgi:hypothetical protein